MPLARLPPAVGVKPKVAVTLLLPATRSRAGIEKEGLVTAPPMSPDGVAVERVGSALVDTFTSPDTCATPMVKPVSVIVVAPVIVEAPRTIVKVVAAVAGVPVNTNPELVAVMGVVVAKKPLG